MNETTVGREPVQILEIKQPSCSNTFGVAPCTATGTADTKCYNTFGTCQDTPNFNAALESLFFTKPNFSHDIKHWFGAYIAGKTDPTLILDYANDKYWNGSSKTISELVTSATAGMRTTTLADGNIGWGGHNLLLNSATLSTQNITTLAVQYTLEFEGAGTVTLSGTSTDGPLVGTGVDDLVSLDFTPTAGTLTLTVSGSVTIARLYHSDLGGMQPNYDGSSYFPTTSPAYYAPAFQHDPVTLERRGVQIERAATNLLTYSAEFDNAAWSKIHSTVLANEIVSPSGLVDADRIAASNSLPQEIAVRQTVSFATTTTYTTSVFAKAGVVNWLRLRELAHNGGASGVGISQAWFDLANGVVGTKTNGITSLDIEAFGNGWYRCSATFTTASSIDNQLLDFGAANDDLVIDYARTVGDSIYLYGAQLETGGIATSYIPTAGAAASRVIDQLSLDTGSEPFVGFDGTQGTWVLKGNWVHNDAATAYMLAGDASTSFVHQVAATSDDVRSTDGTATIDTGALFTDSTDIAVAMSYLQGGAFNILADGSAEATASLTGDLATTTIDIGHLAGANGMQGLIYDIAYYDTQLPLLARQEASSPNNVGIKSLYLIPSLVGASTAPTVINVGGSNQNMSPLGQRAVLRASFQDHPHNGRIVDPYQAGRTFDAFARGSFWSKWLVRNKYHKGSAAIIYDGYVGQDLDDMTSREYIIDNISGPSSSGAVSVTAKDILTKAIGRKAQAPAVSEGELLSDITDVQTSFIATGALIADYPATGTILIGDELMTYSARVQSSPSEVTFTITTRGTDGTTAEAHEAQDTVQTVLEYVNESPWDVVQDLLVNYAGIDSSFIPIADWSTEGTTYLPSFTISAKVVEPTSVEQLVAEISEQCLFYIWWHEVDKEIKLRAIRGIDVAPPTIDDENNIIAGTFSIKERPDRRVSQVWTHYQMINPVEDAGEARNYKVVDILADLDAESANQYGEKSVKRVFSRWLDDRNVVLDFNTKTLSRFIETPREVKLRVDAKDRLLWTGDTVLMSHYSIIDQHGEQLTGVWRIISAEEVVPGEVIEYVLDDATLEGIIVVYMDASAIDYVGDGSDQFNGAWYSDTNGLMSNGDAGGNYA